MSLKQQLSAPQVDLVVPCFNPPRHWSRELVKCFKAFAGGIGEPVRLILINDGSTRGVQKEDIVFIEQRIPLFRYLHHPQNQGKGQALRTGMQKTTAPWILTTDIDFPYENESMLRVFAALKAQGGLVLGNRRQNYYRNVPVFRKALSLAFRLAVKTLLNARISDTQCGLKGMDQKVKAVFLQTRIPTYLYDLEFVQMVGKTGISVSRINVELKDSVVFNNMNSTILAREFKHFLTLILAR